MVISLYCKRCKCVKWLILSLILDVDECLSNSYSCHKEASCVNTRGSYSCSCNPGLTGDGKRKCDGKS